MKSQWLILPPVMVGGYRTLEAVLSGQHSPRSLSQRLLILTCAVVSLALSSATIAADPGQPIRAGGLEIFYGVIPAEILLGHPGSHEERKMHGGTPKGRGQYPLIVSVFEGNNQKRLENSTVTARVGEIGLSVQEKRLEPMQFGGTVTYGNYFRMAAPGPYRIELEIRRESAPKPVKSTFEYSHLRQ